MPHHLRFVLAGILMLSPLVPRTGAQSAPQTGAPSTPAPATVPRGATARPAYTRVTSVEGITEYRLANGLRVLLFPDPTKRTVTVNITYLVGSRHENYGETGMAHLLEHLLFKGSTAFPNVPKTLAEHGASWNGTTWTDRTNYFETVPATEANLKWALAFEADRMVHAFVAKKDLDTEFSVVRNELESGENAPARVLGQRVSAMAYDWHNYGKDTIGARSDVENVPIDRLRAFYRRYYQPDNAVLAVAGQFDEAKTMALVASTFAGVPKPARALPSFYTVEPAQDGERLVTVRRVGDVQLIRTAHHIPPASHPDFAATEVLFQVLGDAPAGRLHKALVESGLATNASAFVDAMFDPGLGWTGATLRKDSSIDAARTAMLDVIDRLTANPPSAEEVARARTRLLKQIELELAASDEIGLDMSEYVAAGDWRLFFLRRDRIRQVTPADVQRVAAAYVVPSNRTVGLFIATDAPVRSQVPARPDVAAMLKDYRGEVLLAAGEAFDPSPANIEARTTRPSRPTGVTLALLPKKTRGATVNGQLSMQLGNEKDLSARRMGLGIVTGNMLLRGTLKRSRQQIQDEFDRLSANVSVSGAPALVSVQVETTRANLPGVLRLVAEILREPGFPATEFDQLKRQLIQGLEASRQQPGPAASLALSRQLDPYPVGHPRHVLTVDERLAAYQAMTLDEVKQFHKDFYGTDSIQVALVGDFDDAAAAALVDELFAGWKNAIPFVRMVAPYKAAAPANSTILTPDKPNASFNAGMNISVRQDDADYAALVIGNYMLGGDFNSRIVARLRQKEGLSYGAGSGLSADFFERTGRFSASAIAAPENIEKLERAFREEVTFALKDGFTAEELRTAKAGWLQSNQVDRAQDSSLASTLRLYLFEGRTLNWDRELEQQVARLTPAAVLAAMRRHIDPAKITIVKAGDFKRGR